MKLQEKMYTLPESMVKSMERQFKKDNVNVKTRWYKELLHFFVITDECDTFLTIFSKKTHKLYCSMALFNEVDTFDEHKGQMITVGKMCKNTDFLNSVKEPISHCQHLIISGHSINMSSG